MGRKLTVPKAAAVLGVATSTLYRWLHERRVPSTRLGPRCYRLDEDALREWLAARTTPAVDPPAPGAPHARRVRRVEP